jgi:hypothetical protein
MIDYLYERGAFRNERAATRAKKRVRLEANRRWMARNRPKKAQVGVSVRGVGGSAGETDSPPEPATPPSP